MIPSDPAVAVWALVPVKDFDRAKSRLHPALDGAQRRALAQKTFEHVLAVLRGSEAIAGVLVVTDAEEVAREARARGAAAEVAAGAGPGRPLGRIVDEGLASLARRGAGVGLVLMGDLPRVAPAEVRALVGTLVGHDLVLAPDGAGEGTNALVVRVPAPMPSCFGRADSYAAHRAAAAERGLRVAVCEREGLAFDVDGPADLGRL